MIPTFIKSHYKTEFARNVFTLFSGTSVAQIIPFIVSPILTRLYTPDDFGLLALLFSFIGIIAIVTTLQYESAIMLPKEDIDAINIVGLCLIITTCLTLLTLISILIFNHSIAKLLGDERLAFWLYFAPLSIFLTGLYNTLNFWSSRKKQYKRLAIRTIAQSGTTTVTKLIMGLTGATNSGLIIGTVAGQLTATGVLTTMVYKEYKVLIKQISKDKIKQNAFIHSNFPKYSAWQGFSDMFNASGTNFIISASLGSGILGLYSFTVSILQKPLQLIGNAVTQVYYQKASVLFNEGINLWPVTKKLIIRLSILSLFIFIPLLFFGPVLFKFLFGDEWLLAGKYAQLLIPWMFARFICSPLANIGNILNKQKTLLFLVTFYNLLFPICFICFIKLSFSFELSLFFLSILSFVYYFYIIIWIRQITKK